MTVLFILVVVMMLASIVVNIIQFLGAAHTESYYLTLLYEQDELMKRLLQQLKEQNNAE